MGNLVYETTKYVTSSRDAVPVVGFASEGRGAGLAMTLVDYVPCHRSEAGSGSGMGFARWM
jgi:hypothetical protein